MIKLENFIYQRALQQWELKRTKVHQLQNEFKDATCRVDVVEPHFNHAHQDAINKVFKAANEYKGDKIIVIGGDSMNLDRFSGFYSNTVEETDPEDEIDTLVSFIRQASKIYRKVIFLATNHENRIKKVIFKNIKDKKVAGSVAKQMKTLKEIFELKGLDKVVYTDHYVFKIGDTYVTHFENNTSIPGTVGEKVMRGLNNLYGSDWVLAVQCHTHSMSKNTYQRQTVIESGTLQVSPDYWVNSGKICGERKSAGIGYATYNLIKGKVDINSANYIVTSWREYL